MKKFIAFLLLMALASNSYPQQKTRDNQNFISNKLPEAQSSQTMQSYYQSLYQQQQQQFQQGVVPGFDIDKTALLERLKELIPLEGPIDAEAYIVGPGDLLSINVWSALPFMNSALVTPEGTIIIPTVGIVDVAGKTLAEVKEAVTNAVRKIYIKGEITTSLIAPRIFSVTISGLVSNPGSYFASAVQRVDQVIYQANLQTAMLTSKLSMLEEEQKALAQRDEVLKYYRDDELYRQPLQFSLRNIKLIRKTGDTLAVDLVRYYATGNTRFDPLLLDGDRVIVPNMNLQGNSLTISGAVRLQGTYEFFPGDSISSIFEIAQGPTNFADLEHIDLYRIDATTGQIWHQVIDYTQITNRQLPDVALQPMDRIIVREQFPHEYPSSVRIRGEVLQPGMYPITREKTRLTEIVTLAGGFTSYASLAHAKVFRSTEPLDKLELNPDYARLSEMRLSDMNATDREYFNFEALLKRNILSINFPKLFDHGDSTQDVILKDGDVIFIPSNQKTIIVLGQVPYPGQQQFISGKDYKYYIKQAGGETLKAWESRVRVIKAGSKEWVRPTGIKLEPGDAIWVPRIRENRFEMTFFWIARVLELGGS
ncbi:SLBB domain-containing protein, partial [candidate division KSB1 bacterium]|nr:SLBB domain-containing protein [candidate division KSB1 bacterium]